MVISVFGSCDDSPLTTVIILEAQGCGMALRLGSNLLVTTTCMDYDMHFFFRHSSFGVVVAWGGTSDSYDIVVQTIYHRNSTGTDCLVSLSKNSRSAGANH
mmetsp:Transcript_16020/g.24247  ORF Transcript_16020/g.24247 Transcript_16020/m.24247 type:complete len:101 (-) Transcript_16020:683-985(-)